MIEAPCSKLQGIFDPQGSAIYSNRSLTPQKATGNALAPGFNERWDMNMLTPMEERDKALSVIDPFLYDISMIFRDCYLSEGKGALLVYADSVINGNIPTEYDYATKNDVLEIIDGIDAKAGLAVLLSTYDPHTEGILVLVPSNNNAPFFITVKLKSRSSTD